MFRKQILSNFPLVCHVQLIHKTSNTGNRNPGLLYRENLPRVYCHHFEILFLNRVESDIQAITILIIYAKKKTLCLKLLYSP